jgi:hypothetical protein
MMLLEVRRQIDELLTESWNVVQDQRLLNNNKSSQESHSIASFSLSTAKSVQSEQPSISSAVPTPSSDAAINAIADETQLVAGECSQRLQDLCPLCFGGSRFGRPLQLCVCYLF